MNATTATRASASTRREPTVPDSIEEAALLRRLQAGDAAAYETLVRRFSPRMLAVARRLLRNEDDARDALQEALLSAFKAIGRFEGHAQLGTWLHRIVVNAALMKLRSLRRCAEVACPIEDLLPDYTADGHRRHPRPAWQAPAASLLEQREVRAMVRRKIGMLPEEYRNVLMLRDIEELDTAETATCLGITPGAVKTRLHRARMALRELLEMELV
jgi:RNA polymerase sigma-70 factor (ECF subfamily)